MLTLFLFSGALVLLLLMYGWSSIPLAYLFSFPFQTAAAGFAVLTFICIVAGRRFSSFLPCRDTHKEHREGCLSNLNTFLTSSSQVS